MNSKLTFWKKNRIYRIWNLVYSKHILSAFMKVHFELFHKKENFIRIFFYKNKIRIFALSLFVFMVLYSYNLGYEKHQVETKRTIDESIQNKHELDEKNEENIHIKQKLDDVINSKEYKRFKIYKASGMLVPKSIPEEHLNTMISEAKKRKIPTRIFFRLVYAESQFHVNAKSNCGAQGYMQLMPSTYDLYRRKLNLTKSTKSNIIVGSYYLKEMYNYFNQRRNYSERKKWTLALASYNASIDRVIRDGGVPDIDATKQYVKFIMN